MLLSSQAYERHQADSLGNVAPADTDVGSASTLPDPKTLVSFNPIVALEWSVDDAIYFQTAFVKRMVTEADSVISFARWHRIYLSPQDYGK
jgi:hypothetical protein